MCFSSFFFLQPPSSCDWLTSLLILSYNFTSFWKDVHGVSLLDNNIALLVLLFYVRGEFRSSGQPSAVSNLHRHSGKTTEESQKEKDYYRNPWHHSEGARYGSSALQAVAPSLLLEFTTLTTGAVKSTCSDTQLLDEVLGECYTWAALGKNDRKRSYGNLAQWELRSPSSSPGTLSSGCIYDST